MAQLLFNTLDIIFISSSQNYVVAISFING